MNDTNVAIISEEDLLEVCVREVMENEAGERGIYCFDVTACVWATSELVDDMFE